MTRHAIVSADHIAAAIHVIRGQRVMLSADLAQLYGVEPRSLVQAVKRNRERFPADFMFQLTAVETANLKSQSVISSHGGARSMPHAFTEQGIAMLSSVLRSRRAVLVNVEIMRAFVRLRGLLTAHADLGRRLDKVEGLVFDAIRELMRPPDPPSRKQVGFRLQA